MGRATGFQVQGLWPLLFVSDIQRSLAFYTGQLGFEVVGRAESGAGLSWCRLQRGAASFMLQQHEAPERFQPLPPATVVLYFVCDDADAVFLKLTEKGMTLDRPTVAYYGMKQLAVPDPDGYDVIFESRTEAWGE